VLELELTDGIAQTQAGRRRRDGGRRLHRQMPEQELRSAAEDHGPLQDVLQLAHVTPPWLGGQGPQRLGLDAGERCTR
jgi:hypothetical protein